MRDTGADGMDRPGTFQTRRKGRLGLVLVLARDHEGVGEVEAGGPHLDQHLVGARLGFGQFSHTQGLRPLEGWRDDRTHQISGPSWAGRTSPTRRPTRLKMPGVNRSDSSLGMTSSLRRIWPMATFAARVPPSSIFRQIPKPNSGITPV